MAQEFDPKVLGGSVKRGIINPDLLEERQKCNFDQAELVNYMFTPELVAYIEKANKMLEDHPELQSGIEYYELTREEKMRVWWRRYRFVMESDEYHE